MISTLQKSYARLAGPHALGLLEKTRRWSEAQARLAAQKTPPSYCKLPMIGEYLKRRWESRRKQPWIPPVEGLIWRVEALDGKSEEEQRKTALGALKRIDGGADEVSQAAAEVLAEKWPDEWDALLASRIEEIPLGDRFARWIGSVGPRGGTAMLQAMADGPESRTKVLASSLVWERSHDAQLVKSGESMVRSGEDWAPDAAVWLALLYARGDDVGDVPAFFRDVLGRCMRINDETEVDARDQRPGRLTLRREVDGVMKHFIQRETAEGRAARAVMSALWSTGHVTARSRRRAVSDVLWGFQDDGGYIRLASPQELPAPTRGDAFTDILEDMVFAPERVFRPEARLDEIERYLGAPAVAALRDAGERGLSLLVQAVEGRPLAQPRRIGGVFGALGAKGDVRALPALEALLARIEAADRAGGADVAEPFIKSASRDAAWLRDAILLLRFYGVSDKVGYLAGVSEGQRKVVTQELLMRACDAETLQAMLADVRLGWARPAIVAALHGLRMKGS